MMAFRLQDFLSRFLQCSLSLSPRLAVFHFQSFQESI